MVSKLVIKLAIWLLTKINLNESDEIMMALLFAQRVILGKNTFEEVPAKLKAQVASVLIDECGLPELVPSEFGGTADVNAE
mgnify:CR=1 FL=1